MAFIARSLRKGPHTWAARGAWEPRDCPESLWYGFYHITEVGARTTCTRAQPTLRYDVHTRLARRLEHVHNSSTPPGALLDVYDARSHVSPCIPYRTRSVLYHVYHVTRSVVHQIHDRHARPHGSGFRDGIPRVNSVPETHSMEPPPRTTQDESLVAHSDAHLAEAGRRSGAR